MKLQRRSGFGNTNSPDFWRDALPQLGASRCAARGPGEYTLPRTDYFYFSLLPIDAVLRGVTIEGAKYPLCDAEARRGDSLTISNEWIEPTVRLRIREGLCWLICSGPSAR